MKFFAIKFFIRQGYNRNKKFRKFLYGTAFVTLLLMFAVSLDYPLFDVSYSPVLYDRDMRLLGAQVALDGQWRFPGQIGLNEKFIISLIEAEDRRFRMHPGIDPLALTRAMVQNIRSGQVVSGASTITMQTIRLSRTQSGKHGRISRNLFEKAVEMVLSLRLELGTSKDNILALYAANAPFGANVVGLEAAAWRWFGRSSEDLSWAEAATLAVLPNSPGLIHPGRNREALRIRRDALLQRLFSRGYFDHDTLLLSLAENVPGEPLPLPRLAPHLLDRLVLEAGGSGNIKGAFVTSIDRDMQERAATILNRASRRFSENHIMNGAVLIINTQTGEPLAYVGNTNTSYAGDVDIIRSWRSSGSLLKPFLYAAMLDSGDILPSSLVSDIPTRVGSFSPENITRTYLGVVPADEALIRSLNVPAARSLRLYGVDRFARLLRSLGLTTLFRSGHEYGLPLVLGGSEITLWEITGLYAGLGRLVNSRTGSTSTQGTPAAQHVSAPPISAGAAWITLNALVSTVRPGDEAIWQEFASSRNIAWKTGTSFGFRDAWAIGVTPEWTVGVWIGNATGEGRAELRSATTSAPVLFEIFSALHSGGSGLQANNRSSWFQQPASELRHAEVCFFSGFPAGVSCDRIRIIELPLNAPRTAACRFCQTITLDNISSNWFVLPPAEEWYFRRWNLDYRPLPPAQTTDSSQAMLALFNPEPGSQVFIPRELDGRDGRLVFSAAHRNQSEIIHWHLDGTYLGSTHTFHEMESRPPPGLRTLTLVDSSGRTLVRRFTVLDNTGAL